MRIYGSLEFKPNAGRGAWEIKAEPHVLMMCKRVFTGLGRQHGTLNLGHTDASAEMLEWLMLRYPLEMNARDRAFLDGCNDRTRVRRCACDELMLGSGVAMDILTKLPLRDYQTVAAKLTQMQTALLLGDDLGLGKTSVGLGCIAMGMQPAIVVCKTHLQFQWVTEINKFLDGASPHIIKQSKYYNLPEHNILIITYSKLSAWADRLKDYNLIVFDEAQELRREGTNKYAAAAHLCSVIPNKLGLTATPVYNYGDEIFNLIDLLSHGALGTRLEFLNEWCVPMGNHYKVVDPRALGSFLAESHLFLRRRRAEVGRELPPVIKISEEVEYSSDALLENEDRALELAKAILKGAWNDRGKAALELDAMMRMQTGIAKAPFVADFVRQLVESGESVVLAGWHREVYTVWERNLRAHGIKVVSYTGSESPNQKRDSVQEFVNGAAEVIMLSLRSGEGLNGLQSRSCVIVFGELDWSPQVHEQCIGRLNRDGQEGQVTAIYLYAGGGSDPVIAQVLGVKKGQSEGIINPESAMTAPVTDQQAEISRASALARQILFRRNHAHPGIEGTTQQPERNHANV